MENITLAIALSRQMMYPYPLQPHPLAAHEVGSLTIYYLSQTSGKEGVQAFLEKRPPQFTDKTCSYIPPSPLMVAIYGGVRCCEKLWISQRIVIYPRISSPHRNLGYLYWVCRETGDTVGWLFEVCSRMRIRQTNEQAGNLQIVQL